MGSHSVLCSPGDLPDPGMELVSPALQADSSLPSEPPGKPSLQQIQVLLFATFWNLFPEYFLSAVGQSHRCEARGCRGPAVCP